MKKQIYTHAPTGVRFEVTLHTNDTGGKLEIIYTGSGVLFDYLEHQQAHIKEIGEDSAARNFSTLDTLVVKGVKICYLNSISLTQRNTPPLAYFIGRGTSLGKSLWGARRLPDGDCLTLVDIFEALADKGFYVRGNFQIETEPETYDIIL
jgi:hypothetical protein